MAGWGIDAGGILRLGAMFKLLQKHFNDQLELGMATLVEIIAEDARVLCPVGETGDLKASIVTSVKKMGKTYVEGMISAGGARAPYAEFVHDGTSRMAARPFLHQALVQNIPLIEKVFGNSWSAAITKSGF